MAGDSPLQALALTLTGPNNLQFLPDGELVPIQEDELFTHEWSQHVETPFIDKLREERKHRDVAQEDWEYRLVVKDKDGSPIPLEWTLGVLKTDFAELQTQFPMTVKLQESEVIVRMKYTSVQPLDSLMFRGNCPDVSTPQVLGTEGVGIVVLSSVKAYPEGVQVAFVFRPPLEEFGAWRTYVRLKPSRVCMGTIPYDLSPQTAAAGITSTIVALACLRHFSKGKMIVVTGAGGATGLGIMQLAANKGMRAIGLVRGEARLGPLMLKFGKNSGMCFVDCTAPDWIGQVLHYCEIDKSGVASVDGVVDGMGGDIVIQIAQQVVRPHGFVVRYAAHAGLPDLEKLSAVARSRSLRQFEESARSILDLEDKDAHFQRALSLMAANKYRPLVHNSTTWQDAHQCLVPQDAWSQYVHVSQFTEGRIGRILLKFD